MPTPTPIAPTRVITSMPCFCFTPRFGEELFLLDRIFEWIFFLLDRLSQTILSTACGAGERSLVESRYNRGEA